MSELLFYGGIIAAGIFLTLLITMAVFLRLKWIQLCAKLDEEYGKRDE